MEVERSNLLVLTKLIVNNLIQSINDSHLIVVDSNCNQITESKSISIVFDLLIVIEHCLCHGLNNEGLISQASSNNLTKEINKSNVLQRAKNQVILTASNLIKQCFDCDPWPVLLQLEKISGFNERISDSVLTMNELTTGLGRSRVWLRQALMKKVFLNFVIF